MIGPAYAQCMARYNAWQNQWMFQACDGLSDAQRAEDRGLFWTSIEGTLSHAFWGDMIWISRFDGGPGPDAPLTETATAYDWRTLMAERPKLDARIAAWAWGADASDFDGDLTWYSMGAGREITKPRALCAVQLFNHQTHHRGQVHAALTQLGVKTTDTDLPFMPDEVPEWV
ncbi:DinB family protein [Hasllibacter sp. MH4015]|uniref:DinB family protein n=1 Tax=Hasllibacter sp. MH4015 TaxID=2854029 RepID=UPI001CD2EE22|nr:DinB family protein [Hasllibacter sp. MH4015]